MSGRRGHRRLRRWRARSATKETGGRSRNPTLIASQVELQTMHSVSQAAGIRQPMGCIRGDIRASRSRRKGAASRLLRGKFALACET